MQRKGSIDVRERVEAKDVAEALAKVRTLPSEDEKALRMRYGAKVKRTDVLERHGAGDPELQDELLLIEMDLLRRYRGRQRGEAQRQAPQPSRAKEKIVRALRKKH